MKKNKYNSALAHKAKESLAYEKEQREKRKEHNIKDENVIIVEKSNIYKFTINSIKALFQLVGWIIIIILTIIGLVSLIYPAPRTALFAIINEAIQQLQDHLEPLFAISHKLSNTLLQTIHQL